MRAVSPGEVRESSSSGTPPLSVETNGTRSMDAVMDALASPEFAAARRRMLRIGRALPRPIAAADPWPFQAGAEAPEQVASLATLARRDGTSQAATADAGTAQLGHTRVDRGAEGRTADLFEAFGVGEQRDGELAERPVAAVAERADEHTFLGHAQGLQ